ncbi:hypothetical protein B7Z00_04885, partial [Candidatus Saccharibacteria bacterium 32-50-10]
MYGLVANASAPIAITNSAELCSAIKNQADGQVWQLAPGAYPIGPSNCTGIPVVDGNTNLYLPITADNLTITGIGNPTVYGSGFTTNGDGGFGGDFIAITGDNVTIKNLTVMTKVYPNKVIEVRGSNSIIENVSIKPNTLGAADIDPSYYPAWSAEFAGSIYYHQAGGMHTLTNVSILNGGISLRSAGATFNLNNVHLTYSTNSASLNTYRVYSPSGATINGLPTYTYQVSHALNNIDSVIAAIADPATVQGTENIKLVSDIYLNKQLTINKPNVTIDGKKAAGGNYTIFGNFDKTDFSNNSLLGVQANGTKIKNLNVNGQNRQLHGVNVYEATGVELTDVALSNNAHAGMIVGKDANVTVNNITTKNNGWYGINVDKKAGTSATLVVNGTSAHEEGSKPHIFIDNREHANNNVVDTNAQYARFWLGAGYSYLQDTTAPTVAIDVDTFNPTSFKTTASDDQRLTRIDYSIWKDNNTSQIGVWGQNIDFDNQYSFEKTQDTYCDRTSGSCVFKPFANLPEGEYTLRATAGDVMGKSTDAANATFIVDRTAPSTPSITAPGARQWFNGDNTINSWTVSTDNLSGIKNYEVKYEFVGRPTATRTETGLSRTQTFSGTYQGPITISVRAQDNAGNWSAFSKSVTYNYDSIDPRTDIQISPVVDGTFTVSGDASDNLALNRVYVQLVSRTDGKRYGGTTINLIPEGASAHWSKTYDLKELGYPEGDYAAHVSVVDRAGNSSSAGWTDNFRVEYSPVLTADYFTVHADQLGVGFSIDRFDDTTKVEVELFDAEGNSITKNVGDSTDMVNLLNSHTGQISSPFYIPGKANDSFWTFGSADWKNVTPSYAVVTVFYGSDEPKTDRVDFVSTNQDNPSFTYAALIASLPPADSGNPNEAPEEEEIEVINDEQTSGGQSTLLTGTAGFAGGFTGFLNANTVIDDNTATDDTTDEDGDVAAATTNRDNDEDGDVLAAEDSRESWSLINLILAIAVAGASLLS